MARFFQKHISPTSCAYNFSIWPENSLSKYKLKRGLFWQAKNNIDRVDYLKNKIHFWGERLPQTFPVTPDFFKDDKPQYVDLSKFQKREPYKCKSSPLKFQPMRIDWSIKHHFCKGFGRHMIPLVNTMALLILVKKYIFFSYKKSCLLKYYNAHEFT